jgi:hypothetical protein
MGASRDLMKRTGARVRIVQHFGIDGIWGLREENADRSPSAGSWERRSPRPGRVVAGDCHLANTAITEQTGRLPVHPFRSWRLRHRREGR